MSAESDCALVSWNAGDRPFTPSGLVPAVATAESWTYLNIDHTRLDREQRQREARLPFPVLDGQPVGPYEKKTGIRLGQGEMWHWDEQRWAMR